MLGTPCPADATLAFPHSNRYLPGAGIALLLFVEICSLECSIRTWLVLPALGALKEGGFPSPSLLVSGFVDAVVPGTWLLLRCSLGQLGVPVYLSFHL